MFLLPLCDNFQVSYDAVPMVMNIFMAALVLRSKVKGEDRNSNVTAEITRCV